VGVEILIMTNLKRYLPLLTIGIIMVGQCLITSPAENAPEIRILVPDKNPNAALTPHVPIYLVSNSQIESFCSLGNGTFSNPYIIENYVINVSATNGIWIQNTNAYLVIRNCVVENGTNYPWAGISIRNCENINITGNSVNNNYHGIEFENSSNNIISGNNCSSNESHEIFLDYSNNNTISGNYGNNIALMYLYNSNDNQVLNNNGGIGLGNSNGSTISGNIANNINIGISLSSSNNNKILSNTIINNKYYGISISFSSNNTIWNNYCADNLYSNSKSDENAGGNHWDNGTHGNYWGDYYSRYPMAINKGMFWDTPYFTNGTTSGKDHYPLALYTPSSPIIQSIAPNPNVNGNVTLDWNDVSCATAYKIYRNFTLIPSTGSTHIATVNISKYDDLRLSAGDYAYAVIALNGTLPSAISNWELVNVNFTLNGTTSTSTTTKGISIDGMNLKLLILSGAIAIVVLIKNRKKWIKE
jgi:parallel beta-helix repeat protein